MVYTKEKLMRIATEELIKELVKDPRYVLTNACYSGYGSLDTIFCAAEIPGRFTNRIYIGLGRGLDDSYTSYVNLVKFKDSTNLQEKTILIDKLYSLGYGLTTSDLFTTEKADMVKSLARKKIDKDTPYKFSFTVPENDLKHGILHAMITAHTGKKINKKQQFNVELVDIAYRRAKAFILKYTYRNEPCQLQILNK